jgi:hypothetical protein
MIDTSEKINSMFLHTRKDYWKGSWYPYWTLLVVTIFSIYNLEILGNKTILNFFF